MLPGDLANKASQEGFSHAWDLAIDLGRALRTKIVVPTLGNHDVDSRKKANKDPFHVARNLRPDFPFPRESDVTAFFADGACILKISECAEVVVINSVIGHIDEDSAKRGSFESPHVERLRKKLMKKCLPIRFAMMHHHPVLHSSPYLNDMDVLSNGDQILSALREGSCRFVLHGHKHHADLKIDDHVAVFAAGSFSANLGEFASSIGNLFHIVELEACESTDWPVRGQILSWHYQATKGWVEADARFSGFPHSTGFGRTDSIEDLAKQLEHLRNTKPKSLIFTHPEVLAAAPQIPFLAPYEQQLFEAKLQEIRLRIPDLRGGKLQMGVIG
jgi:predicted phosphodiesterase